MWDWPALWRRHCMVITAKEHRVEVIIESDVTSRWTAAERASVRGQLRRKRDRPPHPLPETRAVRDVFGRGWR
jgi:type IV pilus biogenesis protein CpaD/CtpE